MVFESLRQLLPREPKVVASGGALLGSATWLQIMADVLGRQVAISEVQEASARGAALLALESLGVLASLEQAPDFIGTIYEPDTHRHALYRVSMKDQQELYDKLIRQMSRKREA
jgi:gluconokinase